MSTIFIGPYRNIHSVGVLSDIYRQNILSVDKETVSQSINLSLNNYNFNRHEIKTETKIAKYSNYKNMIQHCPVSSLVPNNTIENNIAIPILDNTILNKRDIKTLSYFNNIWCDNRYCFDTLSNYHILKDKTKFIRPTIYCQQNESILDLDQYMIWKHHKKNILLIESHTNISLIKKIILEFLIYYKFNKEHILVLCFLDTLKEIQIKISEYIKSITMQLNYKKNNMPIITFEDRISFMNICKHIKNSETLLNYGEIFHSLYFWIANKYNKNIVDFTDLKQYKEYICNDTLNKNGFVKSCELFSNKKVNALKNNHFNQSHAITKDMII